MTSKLRLDLPILLPNILHDADACVGRLLAAMADVRILVFDPNAAILDGLPAYED